MQRKPSLRDALQWDDVRLFLALCRSRTVGEAAAALGVDASTVSRRLTALEETLSAALFDRGRDGVAPTAAAEELMPVAEQIEEMMGRFATAAEGLEREVSGLVRITCPPDVAEVVLAPLLAELLRAHPALRVALDAGESVVDLTRREADIALRNVRPARGDLVMTKLTTFRWVLAAATQTAERLGTLRTWSDAPWIGWGPKYARIAPARWFDAHVKGTEPVVRSDSLIVQQATVAAGIGVALLPEPSLAAYGVAKVKVAKELREAAAEWPADDFFLVTHRALKDVPRVRVVWDCLVNNFKAGAGAAMIHERGERRTTPLLPRR
jgi:DNA-binding transcriptional LysR family regulator